jgi:cytochrome P450
MAALAQVDILSRDFTLNPYPFYERIRATRVGILQPFNVYALSRYEDVLGALHDPETYSSSAMYSFFEKLRRTPTTALGRTLVSMDPPEHTVLRNIVAGILKERRSKELSQYVTTLTGSLLDAAAGSERLDIMKDYAEPIALGVVAWILGIDHDRVGDFKRWTDDATVNLLGATGEQLRHIEQNFSAMRDYFVQKIKQERAAPTNNFITGLLSYEKRGALTPEQVLDAARFLLFAGNKTTRYFIGNAVLALLRHPELIGLVNEMPGKVGALVDELLRYDSPSQMALRSLTRDVTFDGATIEQGSVVFLLLGSANRDETKFPEPDRIDITRETTGHLGMGQGIHGCLGSGIAKVESVIALRALVAGILSRRRVEIENFSYFPSLFLRGLSELKLSVRAA